MASLWCGGYIYTGLSPCGVGGIFIWACLPVVFWVHLYGPACGMWGGTSIWACLWCGGYIYMGLSPCGLGAISIWACLQCVRVDLYGRMHWAFNAAVTSSVFRHSDKKLSWVFFCLLKNHADARAWAKGVMAQHESHLHLPALLPPRAPFSVLPRER